MYLHFLREGLILAYGIVDLGHHWFRSWISTYRYEFEKY